MTEIQIVPLISWSIVSAVLFVVVGLAYRTFVGKNKDAANLGSA